MKRLTYIVLLVLVHTLVCTPQLYAQVGEDDGEMDSYTEHRDYLKLEQYFEAGRFSDVMERLPALFKANDATIRSSAYRLLALIYIEKGDLDSAQKAVQDLLANDPYFSPSASDNLLFLSLLKNNKHEGGAMITTASQQAESIEEAPVPVTLITEEMLHNIGARTLKEALIAYVPGMTDIASNDEINIAMRGIYSSSQEKILILLNGHRMNSYATNAATPDFSMSLEKVKQIEVLRGPASSIYGGVALTGVVNIITKDGRDVDGVKVKGSVGNYGQIQGDLIVGKRYMGLDVLAWASIYNATGEKVYSDASDQQYAVIPVSGNITVGGYNKQPTYDLGLNLKYNNFGFLFNRRFAKTVSPMTLSLGFAPYSYDKYRMLNGNKPGNAVTSQIAELSYQSQMGKFSWMGKVFYDSQSQQRYQVPGDTVPDFGDLTTIIPNGTDVRIRMANGGFQCVTWQESTIGVKLQGSYEYKKSASHSGTLLFGGEYNRFNLYDALYLEGINYDLIIRNFNEEKILYTGKESSADAFLQVKHRWGDNFFINAGMRYDYKYRRQGKKINELSPRLAFIWDLPKVNLKLSYSKAFVDAPYFYRSNTLDVQFGYEDLVPEVLHSIQFSVLSDKRIIDFMTFDLNLCYNHATNFIVIDETSTMNMNAGELSTFNVELVSRCELQKLFAEINVTYLRALNSKKFETDGTRLYNIPSLQTNIIAAYKILPNLRIHANANIITEQSTLFTDYMGYTEYFTIPSRCLINAGAKYSIKNLEFEMNVHNLLNKSYTQSGSVNAPIIQQGRWILGSIAYKF